jgi:glucose-1-phosphate cytidylyltransferase
MPAPWDFFAALLGSGAVERGRAAFVPSDPASRRASAEVGQVAIRPAGLHRVAASFLDRAPSEQDWHNPPRMKWKQEQVVILCGGEGTRLREETEFKPKAMVEIGGRPILWHLMRVYYRWGYRRFVLCLGYKGEQIKDYFLGYQWRDQDFTVELASGKKTLHANSEGIEDWEITFVETGAKTQTGGRLFRAQRYVEGDTFLFNYCDGLSDVDLDKLVQFHREKKKIATLTGFHPRSRYGVVQVDRGDIVTHFLEKPMSTDLTSGGFFVMNRRIFDYLDPDCVLETKPMERLSADRELALFIHHGFWYSMDTYKEALALNEMWSAGQAPWKVWK